MKRILPYLKPYRGKMLLGMLLIAVSSVCSLLLPTIMSDILDGGIYTSDWDYILRCCGRMLLVTLLLAGGGGGRYLVPHPSCFRLLRRPARGGFWPGECPDL